MSVQPDKLVQGEMNVDTKYLQYKVSVCLRVPGRSRNRVLTSMRITADLDLFFRSLSYR